MKQFPDGHANPNHASHALLSGQGLEEQGNAACSQQLKRTKFKKSHAQPQCTAAVSSTDCLNL
jgi:hypothetical protein